MYIELDEVERTMVTVGYFFLCRRDGKLIFRHWSRTSEDEVTDRPADQLIPYEGNRVLETGFQLLVWKLALGDAA